MTSVCHLTKSDESVFLEAVVSIINCNFEGVVKYRRRILERYPVLLQIQRCFLSIPNDGQHQAFTLQSLSGYVLDEIAHPAGISPLVVVPRKYLDHVAADHFRVLGIDNRRIGVAFEVR